MRTPIAEGEFYHVYNRGTEKRKIFLSAKDHQRFLFLLYLCNGTYPVSLGILKNKDPKVIFNIDRGEPLVAIHVHVSMSNHIHLLLQAKRGDSSISIFMQKLMTAYTMYFNKLNKRSGALFQGRYKSVHVDNDGYLRYLFAYLHSNSFPIFSDDGLPSIKDIDKVMNYKYSSILDYRGIIRPENAIVDQSLFKEFCKDDEMIKEQLKAWLTYHSGPPFRG